MEKRTFKRVGHGYDLTNEPFGKLVAKNLTGKQYEDRSKEWFCECECGGTRLVRAHHLTRNIVTDCGCVNKDRMINNNPGKGIIRSQHRNWKGCGELPGSYWRIVNHGAKVRNLKFEITIEDAWNQFLKQDRKCALTGIELYFPILSSDKHRSSGNASLDRIDSNKGYTKDNIQWVFKIVNKMKMELDEEIFVSMCEAVIKYKNKDKEQLNLELIAQIPLLY